MKQTPHHVDISTFSLAVHLFPTVQSVAEHNMDKLYATGRPINNIKAIHTGCNAAKASSEEAGGLEPVVYLSHTARVILIVNRPGQWSNGYSYVHMLSKWWTT